MFRRSRFTVRPNVSTAGRTAAAPQENPPVNQQASETPKDASESGAAIAATDNKSVVTPSEKPTDKGESNDQNGEGTISSAAVQRRKRLTVKPKVAPGRLSTLPRTPKSPVKTVPEIPVEVAGSDPIKPTNQAASPTAAPQGFQSPRRRRPSEENAQPKMKAASTPIIPEGPGPSAVPPTEDLLKQTNPPKDNGSQLENTSSGSQAQDVLSRSPDKVPSSLPEKEAIEISEKAKTLVSSMGRLSMTPAALSLSRLLNDSSDLQRLAKARKLRELIRDEMHKEKKIKKAKLQAKEFTLDPAKMTMRELIHYLPVSNPMTSSLEEPARENEFVIPSSLGRDKSPETAQGPEAPPKTASPREEEEPEAAEEEEEEAAEEDQDDATLVPQVKVAEDGSLIIDEKSLTVEVQRAKGPNPAEGQDPIFERGSTTTYSSFRRPNYTRPWFSEETDMFFLAISMVGTDFSMICQLFPHRVRAEIKNKFKKEERENSWRIDKAFRERRKLDIEYFSKLLDKILEVQKNRKKLKSLVEKNLPKKKKKRKTKGKKAARKNKMSDLEEGEEEEVEKENEDLFDEEESPGSEPNQKGKRKNNEDASNEEPENKKNKMEQESSQQDEACIPEDAEAALPEDRANSDMSENTENGTAAKETVIKPAKLSRGRAPKPLLSLGKKRGVKPSLPSSEAKGMASDEGGDNGSDGASEEQAKKDASPLRQVNERKTANDDFSSEDEDDTVQPPKPTRYGRMPKPTKPLTYPAKAVARSSQSETTPASAAGSAASDSQPEPKCTTKRRGSSKKTQSESKRPKLVTLRASQSEDSDEENEKHWEEEEVEEEQLASCSGWDSIAPAFVPASLRSPHPVIPEVEETLEELDILVSMPDVLGISPDALCPDETGTAEPCEHQEQLLVDVIDFFSSENTEVTDDDRYNEAAQTLLTMGTLAEFPQSAQNQAATQEHPTGETSVCGDKTSQQPEEEIASKPATQEENSATHFMAAASAQEAETSENVATVEQLNSTTEAGGMLLTDTGDQRTVPDMNLTPQLQASPEKLDEKPPQIRRGRLSKVKPKPNLGRAHSKSQPVTSAGRKVEESHTDASSLLQATDTLLIEKISKVSDSSQDLSSDEIPCNEVKRTEKPSGSEESADQLKSDAAWSCLNTSENQSQCFSDTKLQPGVEQATRDTTRESIDEIQSDTVVTELQETNIDSALEQQSSDHPGQCLAPVEDLPVGKKEERTPTTNQVKESLFQQVKPNLAQTSRGLHPETQTTREALEKNANPTPNPKLDEKTTVNIEADQANIDSPAKPSQISGPVSDDSTPLLDVVSTRTPTEELSTTEEQKSHVGVVGQVESGALTSHQGTSENQNLSKTQFVPSREQTPGDMMQTSDATEEKTVSCVGATESSRSNLMTSNSAISERVGHGANIDSTSVKECDQPVPCITLEKEHEVTSNFQVRRGQKVKPKPNLPQASRSLRSRPQTTKDTFEKDRNPTPNLNVHEKTTVKTEADQANVESPAIPSQISGPISDDLTPSLDVVSTRTPTEELSTTEEQKSHVGVVCPVKSGALTSHQGTSENQNLSKTQYVPSREQAPGDTMQTSDATEEKTLSSVGATESSQSNLMTSNSAISEGVGHGANIDSTSVKECDQPVPCITLEKEHEVTSNFQVRRGQKVKPKPNMPQASRSLRSRPQTTKDTFEKDRNPTPNLNVHEKTSVNIEAEPACIKSPVSDLTPLLDLSSTITPIDRLSTIEDTKTDVGVVGQAEPGAEPTDKLATESSSCNLLKSDSAVPGSEEIPGSQEEEREVASTCQMGRGQNLKTKLILTQTSRRVQSKPQTTKETVGHNTPPVEKPSSPTSRLESANNTKADAEEWSSGNPSQIRSIDTASVLVPSLESAPKEEFTSTGGQKVDVGNPTPHSMSEGSEQKVPQRRQRFSKVKPKPNLGSATKNKQTKPSKSSEPCLTDISSDKTSRQQPVDNSSAPTQLQPAEKDGEHLISAQYSLHTELISSTVLGPTADKDMSSDGISVATSSVAETQPVLIESVDENKSNGTHPSAGESTGDKVEAGPATETNTQPTDHPTEISVAQSLEGGPAQTHEKSTQTDPNESTQQPRSFNDSEAQSRDADQRSETSGKNQAASQRTDGNEPAPRGSSKSSRKTPQIRRGRLVKPKPNVGRKSQPRHVPSKKQAAADSGSHLEGVDAPVSHKSVSEGQLEFQEPAEGAVNQDSPAKDAASAQGCSTQGPDISSQHGSISSTGGIGISTFSDMLLDRVPSDPDEPFFILSLTEIPFSSFGEAEGSASDFFACLPVADASVQQQSRGTAEGLATAGDEPSNMSTEEIGEAGVTSVKDTAPDQAADAGSITEDPVDPHDESAAAQPVRLPETDDATEHPPTKERFDGSARSEAKLQLKPKTRRMKQASETLSASEVEPIPTQESEPPGPSVQAEASDEVTTDAQKGSVGHVEIEKPLTSGKDPVDCNSGAQAAQTERASGRKRQPRGVTSSSSLKTNNAAPSASCEVAPAPSPTPLSEETHPTPSSPTQAEAEQTSERSPPPLSDQSLSTSLCTAELSSSQPREGVEGSPVEEEPLSVSQYFLTDIFTEVEEA